MKQFVIEVLVGRNAKKATRYAFSNKKKITIGRSYGCDVIIDDPYVSPEHLKVSSTDGLLIEDLNSDNGMRYKKDKIQNDSVTIESGDDIHIGHTVIKVFSHDHEVKPTKKINWANHLRAFLTLPVVSILFFFITCSYEVFYEWLYYDDLNYFEKQFYEDSISISLALLVLALITHIASLASKHKIKFTAALSYISALFLLVGFTALLVKTTLASSLNLYYTTALEWGTQAFLLSLSLLLITYMENGKIKLKEYAVAAFFLTAIPFAGFYTHIFPDGSDKLEAHYESSVPIFAWEPSDTISVESFITNNEHIFDTNSD